MANYSKLILDLLGSMDEDEAESFLESLATVAQGNKKAPTNEALQQDVLLSEINSLTGQVNSAPRNNQLAQQLGNKLLEYQNTANAPVIDAQAEVAKQVKIAELTARLNELLKNPNQNLAQIRIVENELRQYM